MDSDKYMIVDLEKFNNDKYITERVKYIKQNPNGSFSIVFYGSTNKVFKYNRNRIFYSNTPCVINIESKGLYVKKRRIDTNTNQIKLIKFTDDEHTFFKMYKNDYYEYFEGKDIYISKTQINQYNKSVWDYLLNLVIETGLINTENGKNILLNEYKLIDLNRDNVPLAQYLGAKNKLNKYKKTNIIYYPFGCNKSQKNAVENALTNQVSIIQGPPGTGKTQTILNIIANLIMQDKTILVVSNNNSAVENVAEKLQKEGLDFIVAQLGNQENQQKFIDTQKCYPDMCSWISNDINRLKKEVAYALTQASTGFDLSIEEAKLKTEYNSLLIETEYNDKLIKKHLKIGWLDNKQSKRIIELLNIYKKSLDEGKELSFFLKLKYSLLLSFKLFSFLKTAPSNVIENLTSAYYIARKREIEITLEEINLEASKIDISTSIKTLQSLSLKILKHIIAKKYISKNRPIFRINNIKANTDDFLYEYPIVLSTTFSAKNCIDPNMVFDYVIMDEASQIDIKTGAMALSCALNAVIVGDDKQLPNVVGNEERIGISHINSNFNIAEKYNALEKSFLQSCTEVFQDAPTELLREHYRCHPKIIEFCNKIFYNGELVTMTTDANEKNVLKAITTPVGNHAKGRYNQREIDVIVNEIIPLCSDSDSIGIITPYNQQASEINKILGKDIASTVHKYQGRECDTIIITLVDNYPTEFSDDANLLNVAISRAKKQLYIVTNGNEMPKESNIYQLIKYIQYNNFEIEKSNIHSVFDILYKEYTQERLNFESKNKIVSEYLSENIIFNLISDIVNKIGFKNIDIITHYPLYILIANWELLNETEISFAQNQLSHLDFILFNRLSKQPICAIEVDGWHFHISKNQIQRDNTKDNILKKIGLPLIRISTNDTLTENTMTNILLEVLGKSDQKGNNGQ